MGQLYSSDCLPAIPTISRNIHRICIDCTSFGSPSHLSSVYLIKKISYIVSKYRYILSNILRTYPYTIVIWKPIWSIYSKLVPHLVHNLGQARKLLQERNDQRQALANAQDETLRKDWKNLWKKRRWWILSLENKQWITKICRNVKILEIQKKWKHKFYVRFFFWKDFGTTCGKQWQIDRKTELVLSRSWGSNRGVELRYPCHMTWDIGTTKCNSDSNMGLNMGDPLKMACFIGKIHD